MKQTLVEYLDWYSFVEFAEVLSAIEEYYTKINNDENTSWWELSEYSVLAENYCVDRWILWFDELWDLIEKRSELEEFDYSYDEWDNYIRACEICDKDPRANWDFTDEECIIESVKQRTEEWDLQSIKNMLEDIDLSDSYFMYDWYWRPRNIERSDSEYVIEEKIKELDTEIENLRDQLIG